MEEIISFNFDFWSIIIIIGTTLISAIIQGASGIGYAGLFMVIMPTVVGYSGALAFMWICFMVVMIITPIYTFRNIDIKKCLKIAMPCLLTNLIGIILGTVVMKKIEATSTELLLILLGIMLLGMGIYFFVFSNRIKIKPTLLKGTMMGSACGLISGFVGVGGPFVSVYLLNATDNANEYLGAVSLPFIGGGIIGTLTHIFGGSYTPEVLGATAISLIPTVAGTLFGLWLANKVNIGILKKIVYAVLMGMGLLLIIQQI